MGKKNNKRNKSFEVFAILAMCLFSLAIWQCLAEEAGAEEEKIPDYPYLHPNLRWIQEERIRCAYIGACDVQKYYQGAKHLPRRKCFAQYLENAGFNFLVARMWLMKNREQATGYREFGKETAFMFEAHDLRWAPEFQLTSAWRQLLQERARKGQSKEVSAADWDYWRVMFYEPMVYFAKLSLEFPTISGMTYDTEVYGGMNGFPGFRDDKDKAAVTEYWKKIEKDVHAINPSFQFIWMPYGFHNEYMRIIINTFGSKEVPVVLFHEQTYSGYSKHIVEKSEAEVHKVYKDKALYVPAIRNHTMDADKIAYHLYMCATHSAGYWIWSLHTMYGEMIGLDVGESWRMPGGYEAHWKAYGVANQKIRDRLKKGTGYQPKIKEPPAVPVKQAMLEKVIKDAHSLKSYRPDGAASLPQKAYPRELENTFYMVYIRPGEDLSFTCKNLSYHHKWDATRYTVFDRDGEVMANGEIEPGKSDTAVLSSLPEGIYTLAGFTTGSSIFTIHNHHAVHYAGRLFLFFQSGDTGPYYFHVPKETKEFTLHVRFAPGAEGSVDVYNAEGKLIETIERNPAKNTGPGNVINTQYRNSVLKDIKFRPNNAEDEIWSFGLRGVVAVVGFEMKDIAPYFSDHPDKLLVPGK